MAFRINFMVNVMVLMALCISGCTWLEQLRPPAAFEPLPVGETVTLTGTVTGSIDACVVDGICAVILENENGQYEAIWNNGGWTQCMGEMERNIPHGAMVTVYGRVESENQVSICPSEKYYIRTGDS